MTTTTKTRKATKVQAIIVLATYIFTHLNRICFTVLSSDGVTTYNTCFENGRGSCTCDGNAQWHKECRHIKYLAPIAAAKLATRNERAQAVKEAECIVSKPARRWVITDPTDAWYGLSDEQIATAIATYEMATDSRF